MRDKLAYSGKLNKAFLFLLLSVLLCLFFTGSRSYADPDQLNRVMNTGGGYSASRQIPDLGFTSTIYDAKNGLPTSDANFILGASDGYIWIAGYSGIIKYDGTTFTRLSTAQGLTNGRGLYEDRRGRIWVGTNDNGVVVIDGSESTHFTYKDGLPASSVRTFAEDKEGNVFIGTTAGICYADPEMKIHILDDERLNEERILRLSSDINGKIYGHTKNGLLFSIEHAGISSVHTSEELGMKAITTILADPYIPNMLYIGTEGSILYHGKYGDSAENMEAIPLKSLNNAHWISYDCGKIWVSSTSGAGYLDGSNNIEILELPMNSGIEMTTSDYQGNLWFASSTQGVMKIVTNNFVDLTKASGLPEKVVNSTCLYHDELYIGTDEGLFILDKHGSPVENELCRMIGDARIRCIRNGSEDDLWIGGYTNDLGLIHLLSDGSISSFTTSNGMPNNEIRSITLTDGGTVLACTNGGLAMIKDKWVIRTIDGGESIKNTVFLTAEQGSDASIYIGTDGDGLYVVDGPKVLRLGRDDGLTSDVIMRVIRDKKNDVLWLVTSNSIEYLKDGVIKNVSSFPFNNNYDLYFNGSDEMWIISSFGIFSVKTEEMLKNDVSDYRLYTFENGLTNTPTSLSTSALSDDGYLYISGRTGVCRVNIDRFTGNNVPIKADISSVYCDDLEIRPDSHGTFFIPSNTGRIRITASVLDYSLLNPEVRLYMEGQEDQGISVLRSDLQPLEYTGLPFGNYDLHLRVMDNSGRTELYDRVFHIVKDPKILEMPVIRFAILLIVILITGFIVWRVMKSTVIRRQYDEIRQARDEAERANTAKSRFLANMSHEIRTPINTIMGMNEMVMREDPSGVPKPYFMSMMNYAFDIRNASESLLSLINDLLDMSKIESGKMHLVLQEYDTVEMLRSVVSMIRVRSTEKELTFDVVVDEVLPKRLYGDQGKIKQIVLNLLTNAVKYTDTGGFALFVSMDERENDECKLRFSVKDTGIGVKEEDMEKLFTAYERLDEEKNSGIQGTGLGLDISRRFAELMGGTLKVESEYGKGSEFILTVSQKIVDRTPVGVFLEHDETNAGGPYVPQFVAPDADILVVDDNPMNLSVIKGLLKGTKVFVSTASSGEECLEKIRDTAFNVVLLDHMMPGMDGVETLAAIRTDYPELPVYALTANSAAGEEFYRSKGFNGYLSKPIDSLTLEKTIMKHLPEEMMEKPAAAEEVAELTEIPPDMQWIYETEGITVPEGIKNSGGISNYIFSLNLFLDTIDGNAKVIRDSYESGNIRLYTIKVHALKSSARIIGAMELSKLAEELEDAGNREDIAFIDEKTGILLSVYENFKEKLIRLQNSDADGEKEAIPEEELREAYSALSDVIPQMDYDSVEMILEQLSGYALPEEDSRIVKELTKKMKLFDWDGMEELMKEAGLSS